MRKGQITFFIIGGIVLAIGALLLANLSELKFSRSKIIINSNENLRNYIELCLATTGNEVVAKIAAQGGFYYFENQSYILTDQGAIAYWFLEKDISPNKEEIEKQIEDAMNGAIFDCFEDIKTLPQLKLSNELNVKSAIQEKKVIFELHAPITLESESGTQTISEFSSSIDVPLGALISNAEKITQMINTTKGPYDIIYLRDEIDTFTHIWTAEEDVNVYQLMPKDYSQKKFVFNLAVKVKDWEEPENSPPVITNVREWTTLNIGDKIVYTFKAEDKDNDSIYFDISNDEFGTLNETSGLFIFEASEADVGIHPLEIIVYDSFGNENFESFTIAVNPPGWEGSDAIKGIMNDRTGAGNNEVIFE